MEMKVVALAGGVGGARLADGLASCLPAEHLTIIVNTADDFTHLGLYISPDLDTVTYTLAGLANPERGWGRLDETWNFFETLNQLGGPVWFRLGDRDLALHHYRTGRLAEGIPLSEIAQEVKQRLGVKPTVLPMSDDPVQTIVATDEGALSFQEYFVARQCEPKVVGFHFEGIGRAKPAPGVLDRIDSADLIVFCPSNPWVSLDPILAVAGIRAHLHGKPVVMVSPIIAGKTVKGPASKMYAELGIEPSALAVAQHYRELLTGFMIDVRDASLEDQIASLEIQVATAQTIMKGQADRIRLAEELLTFADHKLMKEVNP